MRESKKLSAYGEFMWKKVTHSFLDSNLTDEIEELDLTSNHVDMDSADVLVERLTNSSNSLEILNLTQCRMNIKVSMRLIEKLAETKVSQLILDRNLLSQECCESLSQTLMKPNRIEFLSLCGCDILADGAVALSKCLPSASKLQHLHLSNNSIFDKGALALSTTLEMSNLITLAVDDNQIWLDGTKSLLSSIKKSKKLCGLNISYNCIDLDQLSEVLVDTPSLTHIGISGCKVSEHKLPAFLRNLERTRLSTLTINGLDFKELPIVWAKKCDNIWDKPQFFDLFSHSLFNSTTLNDVRTGYLEIEQIFELKSRKPLALSLCDFGHTEDCWVVEIPSFNVLSPCDTFKWNSKISYNGSKCLARLIKQSSYDKKQITKIDLCGCGINDMFLSEILNELQNNQINRLSLSSNEISDESIDIISVFLSPQLSLDLKGTKITENGFLKLMQIIVSSNGALAPQSIEISFDSEFSETSISPLFQEIGGLLSLNPSTGSIYIKSYISPLSASEIFYSLKHNDNIRKLIFDSPIPEKYQGTKPDISQALPHYRSMIDVLHKSLADPSSRCILSELKYPLFTEVFLFDDKIIEYWGDIEKKLDENSKK